MDIPLACFKITKASEKNKIFFGYFLSRGIFIDSESCKRFSAQMHVKKKLLRK